jgi:hypothetical protein
MKQEWLGSEMKYTSHERTFEPARTVELPIDSTRNYVLEEVRKRIHKKMLILPNSYLSKQIQVRMKLTESIFNVIAGSIQFTFNVNLEQQFPLEFLIKTHKTGTRMRIVAITGKITVNNTACF